MSKVDVQQAKITSTSYAKRRGATRRGFLVMRKKKREGGNICPLPHLGRRLKFASLGPTFIRKRMLVISWLRALQTVNLSCVCHRQRTEGVII